jgi:hypothetical protein
MQPAEKIHPLVGSVFASPETSRKQSPQAFNLDVAGTAAVPLPAFGQADQAVLPEIQELAARELPGLDTQEGTPDVSSELTPLFPIEPATPPRPSPQTLRTSISTSQDNSAFEPLFTGQRQTHGHEKNIPAPESDSADAGENAYTALMPIKPVAPMKTAVAAIPGAREFGANPGRSAGQNARNVQSARRTEREPDQIEIHIGRIEVAAVPQPQAVPAARVSRKAESLSEYLARRDKRRP